MARIHIVAALSEFNRGIGKDNKLLWHIPEDMRRFRALTHGHPVIMGRRTFQSIGNTLDGRMNIVITGRPREVCGTGITVAGTVLGAIEKAARESDDVFVIGGARVYEEALCYADFLHLTLITAQKPADRFFPPYERKFRKEVDREYRKTPEGLRYSFVTFAYSKPPMFS